ncbi:LAQU0S12e01442g1_1 [Lachancea quebecensis]|uniref:LAQU0S12e01442g1_1 n=1 Tax=Lachancea quebecensis TaxID=1654605 RepID=A0A0P1KWZ3_9SACH|nr:LAQU0S12e01442g1_1 [Lachancea quebecensis]
MTKSSVAVAAAPGAKPAESNGNAAGSPMCKNCHTLTTPLWRRNEHGAVLCNACGLFLKLHGRSRPISLKTDVIKSRNRKSNHAAAGSASGDSSGDQRKKEHKKRKTQDSRELHAAETLETLMRKGNNGNGSSPPQGARPVQPAPLAAAVSATADAGAQDVASAQNATTVTPAATPGANASGSDSKPVLSNAWRKIAPGNRTPPTNVQQVHANPLPHLSMLFGGINPSSPPSRFAARSEERAHPQFAALDPEILGDKVPAGEVAESHSRLSAAPQLPSQFQGHKSSPGETHQSLQMVPPGPPLTSSALAHQEREHVQPLHMASINEILNSQKPKSEKSMSAMGSPPLHAGLSSTTIPQINSPGSRPLQHNANGPISDSMRRYSSEGGARRMQPGSQYSASPPPMDLQHSIAATHASSARPTLGPRLEGHNRTPSDTRMVKNPSGERLHLEVQHSGNVRDHHPQLQPLPPQQQDLPVSRQTSSDSIQPQPPLVKLLQSQEEVIKLKTRISELELVTDLYKRHIFELDAKCRALEERLG